MKATLVTGASGGIGEAFARKLAERNHNLFLVARGEVKLKAICEELMSRHEIKASCIALDLNADLADKTLFSETEKRGLEIDWLINNAGFGSMGDFSKLECEKELNMIDLNVKALVALTHRYLEQMRERKSGTDYKRFFDCQFSAHPFHGELTAQRKPSSHHLVRQSPRKTVLTELKFSFFVPDPQKQTFSMLRELRIQ